MKPPLPAATLLAPLALALALAAGPAQGQEQEAAEPARREAPTRGLLAGFPSPAGEARLIARQSERLGIPLETIVASRRIASDHKAAADLTRGKLAAAWRALAGLLADPLPDRAVLGQRVRDVGALETELREQTLAAVMEIRALLTPAQRAQLAQVHARRAARAAERAD